jgi:hypothetical protein
MMIRQPRHFRDRLPDFFDHIYCAAGTFLRAHSAPFTKILVNLVTPAGPQLDDGIVGADTIAGIAFETISARQAAPGFKQRRLLIQPTLDFLKTPTAA